MSLSPPTYLMEHESEGARIRNKTDVDATRDQLHNAGLVCGMTALDVGCASGAASVEIGRIAAPGTVVGIDASEARLKEAQVLAQSAGANNLEFHRGDAYAIPFPDDTFDFVWSRFLLEYLKRPVDAIAEMKRVARKGGLVANADLDGNCLFHYPIDPHLEAGLQKICRILAATGFDPWVGRKLYHYYRQVGFQDIRAFVTPHHVIAGEPREDERRNWHEKIDTIHAKLTGVYDDQQELDDLAEAFKGFIDSPETFTYSSLIIVVGKV